MTSGASIEQHFSFDKHRFRKKCDKVNFVCRTLGLSRSTGWFRGKKTVLQTGSILRPSLIRCKKAAVWDFDAGPTSNGVTRLENLLAGR
ncbi:hypothetical protein JNB91_24630 [Rhizobium wenxiniae]|nr:hypothetical protein [Rhizobium wenxiniae]